MKLFITSLRMLLVLVILTGAVYPLLITGIAQLTMPERANGGLIIHEGKVIGAKLIAQKFENNRYFWARPSASDYNPLFSGGSNLGPTSLLLQQQVKTRRDRYEAVEVPSELLFASGSGLDPHISLQAAYFQIDRVAKARGRESSEIKKIVDEHKERFGFITKPYINVLIVNQALDMRIP